MDPQTPQTPDNQPWQHPAPHLPPVLQPQGHVQPPNWQTPMLAPQARPEPTPVWQPPQPVAPSAMAPSVPSSGDSLRPTPVVRVLSPVGLEYAFLTILLFTGAGALVAVLLVLVNGVAGFQALSFPTAMLTVAVPGFAWLFLRLKKMELQSPELHLDPSKRRSTQFTQIVAFIVSLFTLIGLIFSIFAKIGGDSSVPIGKALLDALCVLVVAGGILAYYWHDEHRRR